MLDDHDYSSVGIYWSWSAQYAISHYAGDFVDEIHPDETSVDMVFKAAVPSSAVNWPATIAANLALPAENEMTLLDGSDITILSVIIAGREIPVNRSAYIDNITQYDMMN